MSESKDIVPGVTAANIWNVQGLWVSSPDHKHTIGLVEQESVGGYLAIYKDQSGSHLPLGISFDGIQLPRSSSDDEYRFISWDDLYATVQAYKATQPA